MEPAQGAQLLNERVAYSHDRLDGAFGLLDRAWNAGRWFLLPAITGRWAFQR